MSSEPCARKLALYLGQLQEDGVEPLSQDDSPWTRECKGSLACTVRKYVGVRGAVALKSSSSWLRSTALVRVAGLCERGLRDWTR